MTCFKDETVQSFIANFWCHPWELNSSPSTCEAEVIAMSYQDDSSYVIRDYTLKWWSDWLRSVQISKNRYIKTNHCNKIKIKNICSNYEVA